MLKFISLSSGSNGNCYYLGDEEFSLLIDVGIGGRTIKKRLLSFDIDVSKIDLVLVTHTTILIIFAIWDHSRNTIVSRSMQRRSFIRH